MEGLRKIRESKGISQEKLALMADVSRVTISNLETGTQKNTTSDTLLKLAKALNTTIDSFF